MLEIYSIPTLDMSYFPSDARGRRVTQLSLALICSMMFQHSYPKIEETKTEKKHYPFRSKYFLKYFETVEIKDSLTCPELKKQFSPANFVGVDWQKLQQVQASCIGVRNFPIKTVNDTLPHKPITQDSRSLGENLACLPPQPEIKISWLHQEHNLKSPMLSCLVQNMLVHPSANV